MNLKYLFTVQPALSDELRSRLDSIEASLHALHRKENRLMALEQDEIDAITRNTTAVGSIKAAIEAGVFGGHLNAEDKAALISQLDANSTVLNALLPASVPAPTSTEVQAAATAAATP